MLFWYIIRRTIGTIKACTQKEHEQAKQQACLPDSQKDVNVRRQSMWAWHQASPTIKENPVEKKRNTSTEIYIKRRTEAKAKKEQPT